MLVVLLLFGSGKVSTLMGDFAKGIKSFKKHMAEDEPEDSSMAASAGRSSRVARRTRWVGGGKGASPSAPPSVALLRG